MASDTMEGAPTPVIPRNSFKDMGVAEAARKYLGFLGRGCTHPELVQALLKGKVRSGAGHPDISFRTALQRRPDSFVWIKEKGSLGRWELTEWQDSDE
ncbi:MAG: hypothetical protein ACREBG_24910, partial [Pyrinomonadaceae bacterium]